MMKYNVKFGTGFHPSTEFSFKFNKNIIESPIVKFALPPYQDNAMFGPSLKFLDKKFKSIDKTKQFYINKSKKSYYIIDAYKFTQKSYFKSNAFMHINFDKKYVRSNVYNHVYIRDYKDFKINIIDQFKLLSQYNSNNIYVYNKIHFAYENSHDTYIYKKVDLIKEYDHDASVYNKLDFIQEADHNVIKSIMALPIEYKFKNKSNIYHVNLNADIDNEVPYPKNIDKFFIRNDLNVKKCQHIINTNITDYNVYYYKQDFAYVFDNNLISNDVFIIDKKMYYTPTLINKYCTVNMKYGFILNKNTLEDLVFNTSRYINKNNYNISIGYTNNCINKNLYNVSIDYNDTIIDYSSEYITLYSSNNSLFKFKEYLNLKNNSVYTYLLSNKFVSIYNNNIDYINEIIFTTQNSNKLKYSNVIKHMYKDIKKSVYYNPLSLNKKNEDIYLYNKYNFLNKVNHRLFTFDSITSLYKVEFNTNINRNITLSNTTSSTLTINNDIYNLMKSRSFIHVEYNYKNLYKKDYGTIIYETTVSGFDKLKYELSLNSYNYTVHKCGYSFYINDIINTKKSKRTNTIINEHLFVNKDKIPLLSEYYYKHIDKSKYNIYVFDSNINSSKIYDSVIVNNYIENVEKYKSNIYINNELLLNNNFRNVNINNYVLNVDKYIKYTHIDTQIFTSYKHKESNIANDLIWYGKYNKSVHYYNLDINLNKYKHDVECDINYVGIDREELYSDYYDQTFGYIEVDKLFHPYSEKIGYVKEFLPPIDILKNAKDELQLQMKNFDYGEYKNKVFYDNYCVYSKYIKSFTDNGNPIINVPIENPITYYTDIAINYIDVDVSIMRKVLELLYHHWRNNIHYFVGVEPSFAINNMLETVHKDIISIYDSPLYTDRLSHAERSLKLFAWYCEMGLMAHSLKEVEYIKADATFDYNTGVTPTFSTSNNNIQFLSSDEIDEMVNFTTNTDYLITSVQGENATLTISHIPQYNDIVLTCKCYIIDGGTITIETNDNTFTFSNRMNNVEIVLPKENNSFTISFVPNSTSSYVDISSFLLHNRYNIDYNIKYNGKLSNINFTVQYLLDFMSCTGDAIEDTYASLNTTAQIAYALDKFREYMIIHHDNKLKGRRLTIMK